MTSVPRLLVIAAIGLALAACATTRTTVNDLLGRNQGYLALDRNHDGLLSRSEVQELPELAGVFDRIDTDDDGSISRQEFQAANSLVVDTGFQSLDLNGDGVISQRESQATRRSLKDTFSQVDADKDGNVSNTEYQAATYNLLQHVSFQQADLDRDGVLDRQEAAQHLLLADHFAAMDVNNDNLVSTDEFRWAQR